MNPFSNNNLSENISAKLVSAIFIFINMQISQFIIKIGLINQIVLYYLYNWYQRVKMF